LQQWEKQSSYKAFLFPTVAANHSLLSLRIYAQKAGGTAIIHLFDLGGALLGIKTLHIQEGKNEIALSDIQRPTHAMYLVKISYPDQTVEILKGITE
jgi:hypothetical protein